MDEDYLLVARHIERNIGISLHGLWPLVRDDFSENWWRFQEAVEDACKRGEAVEIRVKRFDRLCRLYVPGKTRGWTVEVMEP